MKTLNTHEMQNLVQDRYGEQTALSEGVHKLQHEHDSFKYVTVLNRQSNHKRYNVCERIVQEHMQALDLDLS